MINAFTRKFYNSLMKIEYSEKLSPFFGEDTRQTIRLEYMKEKYESIVNIIEEIDQT